MSNQHDQSIYDFECETISGEMLPLSNYKGKAVLIVNTASKCGFTPQYDGLEALYKKYAQNGLEVLGFPCNQFGNQEPGTNADIQSFCSTKFDVSFPMFAKVREVELYQISSRQKRKCVEALCAENQTGRNRRSY